MKLMHSFLFSFFFLILQEPEIIWVKSEDAVKPQQLTLIAFLAFIVTCFFEWAADRNTNSHLLIPFFT